MTKVICERRDCEHWVEGECSQEKIEIKEKTISPNEEVAFCKTYKMVAGAC